MSSHEQTHHNAQDMWGSAWAISAPGRAACLVLCMPLMPGLTLCCTPELPLCCIGMRFCAHGGCADVSHHHCTT